MNRDFLLDAIGEIDSSYILSAAKKLDCHSTKVQKKLEKKRSFRKMLLVLAAAITMLLGTFSIALAANKEFRETVFDFLGIKQPEPVNQDLSIPKTPNLAERKINLGDIIEGNYICTPLASYAKGGVFLVCSEEPQMKQGSRFEAYCEENGTMRKLETHRFQKTLTVLGKEFSMDLDWVEYDNRTIITDTKADAPYYIADFAGSPEQTLVLFDFPLKTDTGDFAHTYYPAFVNFKTETLIDVLAGTGADKLKNIAHAAVSKDGTKILLLTYDSAIYYADLNGKKLYDVSALSGETVTDCSLIDNTLVCWQQKNSNSFGTYKIWTLDLTTFERKELFSSTNKTLLLRGFSSYYAAGTMHLGNCFAVQTDENQNISVIDLQSGEIFPVENFKWPKNYSYIGGIPSPDGRKLLILGENQKDCFEAVGVFDFDQKQYLRFSRENLNAVEENFASWFDNEQIVLKSSSIDMAEYYYIYKLTTGK